jgi:tRNA(Ile)-lysidine synthetase-like protein
VTPRVTPPDYPAGGGRGTVRPARAREAVRRAVRSTLLRLPEVFARGNRLVVAYSGGQDSTCLLHAMAHAHRDLELTAIHVDHGLRAESAQDALRVSALAQQIGVRCEVVRVDVRAYQTRHRGASLQQAARAVRYQALAEGAARLDARAILVAHTADDQAETVLLNLLRGAGLMGLAGMRMRESLDPLRFDIEQAHAAASVVRPLLRIARSTTLAYCSHFGLGLVEDASNQSRAYTRNRVRLDLLPQLEQFNPAIRTLLARTAELASDDLAAIEAQVDALAGSLLQDGEYDLRLFRAQPPTIQRRLLRRGLASLAGLVDVADAPIEDALDLLRTGQPNQTYHLPYGVELRIGSRTFELRSDGRARRRQKQKTWEVTVSRV